MTVSVSNLVMTVSGSKLVDSIGMNARIKNHIPQAYSIEI
jgi:hypothetical protein